MTIPGAASKLAASSPAGSELNAVLREISPALREQWGDSRVLPARMAWQQALHRHNWVAPAWPIEYGGRGLSIRERVACSLVLAENRVPPMGGILGIQNVGYALMAFGTPAQKASLPKILSTEELWCQGFSEPEAGSDLASLRTRAIADGDEFVVNGQKIWTSEGMNATHCLLLARTDPAAPKHQGISAFTVDMTTPGIECRPIRQITGESDFAEVFFSDMRVPAANLLGPLNGGWGVTTTTLAHERAGVIGMAAEMEVNVTNQIVAVLSGDSNIGQGASSVVLRERMARCYANARVAGLLGMAALQEAEAGGAEGAQQSLIKLIWSSTTQEVSRTLLEVHGSGNAASSASTSYLYGRGATIAGGTTEILKSLAGERVLGLAREPRP